MTVLPFALGERKEINIGRLSVVRGMGDSTLNGKKHETIFLTNLDWLWLQICGQDRSIDGMKIDVHTLVNIGYTRPAIPIESVSGEIMAQILDNKSYAFEPK